jgi:IstB-like ATP binding protein
MIMERTQIFDLMGELKLYGMRSADDEVMANGIKRQHEPPKIVGDLLRAEIDEKTARSIKYQLTIAKLPLAKGIDDFTFERTPINETLVRDLSIGAFLTEQRLSLKPKTHLLEPQPPRLRNPDDLRRGSCSHQVCPRLQGGQHSVLKRGQLSMLVDA